MRYIVVCIIYREAERGSCVRRIDGFSEVLVNMCTFLRVDLGLAMSNGSLLIPVVFTFYG